MFNNIPTKETVSIDAGHAVTETLEFDNEEIRKYAEENCRINGSSTELYDIAFRKHIGKRDCQQDSVFAGKLSDNCAAAVLCDGMGGVNGGEKASSYCLDSMLTCLRNIHKRGSQSITDDMVNVACDTDTGIYSFTDENGNRIGSGTTLVSIYIDNSKLYWLSVGDSRLYIVRDRKMLCMTDDHIYLNRLLKLASEGHITYEEAIKDKQREALTSYIGIGKLTQIDCCMTPFTMKQGDIIMLCSDGIYKFISEDRIRSVLIGSADMESAADGLIAEVLASNNPYQDNIATALIRYNGK